MSEPYLGQVEVFSFNFAPQNWTTCSGQLLQISQNQALFSLLGTTYGGDGIRTFGLPDLRGRFAVGWGQGHGLSDYTLGEVGGQETHTINIGEMANHNHGWMVNSSTPATANTAVPSTSVVLGQTTGVPAQGALFSLLLYNSTGTPSGTLDSHTIGLAGGSQPHDNRMPYLTLNFCIALRGGYPSRN
jgi:microcystin-dependent protein